MTNEAKKTDATPDLADPVDALVMRCRELEIDHAPEGWPAIQMRDVTALCDEIERLAEYVVDLELDAIEERGTVDEIEAFRARHGI